MWPEPEVPVPFGWPPGFGEGPGETDAVLALTCVDLIPRELHALVWETGSASDCLRAIRGGRFGPGRAGKAARASALAVRDALHRSGARVLLPGDPDFPEMLLNLPDPPACLFATGTGDLRGDAVAVVGARRCSAYGREMAGRIGRGLADQGIAVVSGAARGVDAAAHAGALRAGGPTVAVLGSGIDVRYPPSSRNLLERIARTGAIVSEYPPGTPPSRHRFPARNRLIAGLSLAITVVEGEATSGALITVGFAEQLGRELLAVPGRATDPVAEAPNALLVDGAAPVRHAQDITDLLRGRKSDAVAALRGALPQLPPDAVNLSDEDQRILTAVVGDCTADDVSRRAGVSIATAVATLGALELRGLVQAVGGRYHPPPRTSP